MSFIHLHTHSHYSLLDGLAKIDGLVGKAKEHGMGSLALTDHGVMYGTIEFFQKAKKAGVKPIVGVEAYLARNGRHQKRARIDEKPFHLVLLAKNKEGYSNLVRLTTLAHLEGFYYKPRIDWELLQKHSKGLIALSACLAGEIPQAILNRPAETEKTIEKYLELFGKENFYLEVQHHPSLPEQEKVNEEIFSLAKKYGAQVVATNDIHYLEAEDAEAQDVLLCLQTKRKKEDKDRMCMLGEDYSFRSPEKMAEDFKNHPEALANTVKIAADCNLDIDLGEIKLPRYDLPNNKTADGHLKELCLGGLEKKYGIIQNSNALACQQTDVRQAGKSSGDKTYRGSEQAIVDRLEYEAGVIEKTGFAPYFLIVQDFVNWAKENGIVVGPGRGSAAGSIVSYLLGITDIDPLKYDLLFERFLNPERISMPDIDLDFADTRRDEVIRYVEKKYGQDHVCQIITFGTMAARAAIRDVGRVMDLPYVFCDQVAKMIPLFSDLEKALNTVEEMRDIYQNNLDAKKLIDMAKKLEGVCRHASMHACGVIISKDPLIEVIPAQYASSSDQAIVSQYEMKSIEAAGLLKMDFLGLKNLTLIENALNIIEKTRGGKIDLGQIPLDDKKTFKLLQKGETTGVFQLESSGMKRYLKQLKPTVFEDVVAMCALYRPGPLSAGFVDMFVRRKNGQEKISYDHPDLETILKPTYGVTVYQEQVMQVSRQLAGFTGGQADTLRKAIGKKNAELLAKMEADFIGGCEKNGVSINIAKKIWNDWQGFAEYAFNKSHSACYAMIAYQTAYLKANYPVEFMTALLAADQQDLDRIAIEVEECGEMGIEVLPPDVNESFKSFATIVPKKDSQESELRRIRFGLLAIKNVGVNIVETIIAERKENGAYQNLEDFLRRVQTKDLNKKSLESLVKCGAMDEFGERGQMLYNMERLLDYAKSAQKEKENGQASLFGTLPESENVFSLKLEAAPATDSDQRLAWEKELLGLYISDHPFKEFEPYLKDVVIPCQEISRTKGRASQAGILAAGIITSVKKIITRSNESMVFAKMEDTAGNVEILVFPSLLKSNPEVWQEGKVIMVSGKISDKDGETKLLANKAKELTLEDAKNGDFLKASGNGNYSGNSYGNDYGERSKIIRDGSAKPAYAAPVAGKIHISVNPASLCQSIDRLKNVLLRHSGNSQVYLLVAEPGQDLTAAKTIATNFHINCNDEAREEIERVTGKGSVKKE